MREDAMRAHRSQPRDDADARKQRMSVSGRLRLTSVVLATLLISAISLVLSGIASTAQAQSGGFPNRQITLIVPFAPGGVTDLAARVISERLAQILKVPVIVD